MTVGRCHANVPVTDAQGNLATSVNVTLVESASQTFPQNVNFYVREVGGQPIRFPVTFRPGIIEIWSDTPIRVDLLVQLPSGAAIGYQGVDISPPADNVTSAPTPMKIGYADLSQNSVLISATRNSSNFQVIAPTITHQHAGDSASSVVLTNEDAKDFNPQQTWIGYHAGENDAYDTTGSTAIGKGSLLQGANATVVGGGSELGDSATIVAPGGASAGSSGTVIGLNGAANSQGVSVGANNTVMAGGSGTTVLGSDNNIYSNSGVILGDAHTDVVGNSHVYVGHANKLYPLPVSQVPAVQGYVLGSTSVASNIGSSTDWFGGGAWGAVGYPDQASDSRAGMILGDLVANLLLKVDGNAAIGGAQTYSSTTSTVGFFGSAGATRPSTPLYATDTTSTPIPALTSLIQALNSLGLIRNTVDSVVKINFTQPVGSPVEAADTGQALQWLIHPTSVGYQATNPFQYLTGPVVGLADQTKANQFGIFSTGNSDGTVSITMHFDPAATSGQKSGILFRSQLYKPSTTATLDGLLVAKDGVYPYSSGVIQSPLATYSAMATDSSFKVVFSGTSITVIDTTSGSVTKASFTSSYNQTKVKAGFMLSKASTVSAFSVI